MGTPVRQVGLLHSVSVEKDLIASKGSLAWCKRCKGTKQAPWKQVPDTYITTFAIFAFTLITHLTLYICAGDDNANT